MKSKSNPLLILVVITIFLFLSALIWKFNSPDNSEEISIIDPYASNSKEKWSNFKKRNLPVEVATAEPNTADVTEVLEDQTDKIKSIEIQQELELINSLTKVERRQYMQDSYSLNTYIARLTTQEKLVEALLKFEKNGETKKADKVMDKLLYLFPDYELP